MKATKSSWKNSPLSTHREIIPFEGFYTDNEAVNICNGLVPESMDDKWFIYSENDWVYFHRSWTGHCIYKLKLDGASAGVRVTEAWVSRDSSYYNSPGADAKVEILSNLIRSIVDATG